MGRVLKAIQVATKYKYRHYGCRRLILRDKHKPRMLLVGSSEATHEAGWLTTWPALMTSAVCVVMGYWIAFRYWDWPTTLYRFSSWRALLIFEKYPKPTWSCSKISHDIDLPHENKADDLILAPAIRPQDPHFQETGKKRPLSTTSKNYLFLFQLIKKICFKNIYWKWLFLDNGKIIN